MVQRLGPQYAIELKPNRYINEIIKETENAIRQIETKWQNTYIYLAAKLIKQIKENNKQSPLHKTQYNTLRKLKTEMDIENITIMKADKSKAIVLIDKNKRHEKVTQFIQDNNIPQIKTDPTTKFQKQTQQAIQKCRQVINRKTTKQLINTQSKAPKLNT